MLQGSLGGNARSGAPRGWQIPPFKHRAGDYRESAGRLSNNGYGQARPLKFPARYLVLGRPDRELHALYPWRRMMDIIETLIPLLAPLLIGTIGALAASVIITSKRLRTELQQESEMLERLPAGARAELRADMRRRALLLVSINRFPPLTRVDLLALLGVALSIGAGVLVVHALTNEASITSAPSRLENQFGILGVIFPGYALTAWSVFHRNWTQRSLSRIRYLHKHLDPIEPQSVARMVLVGYATSLAVPFAAAALTAVMLGVWIYPDSPFTIEQITAVGTVLAIVPPLILVIGIIGVDGLAMEVLYTISIETMKLWRKEQSISRFEEERARSMRML